VRVTVATALALFVGVPIAHAQKDIADPLEHFLQTTAPGRAQRVLDDGVARMRGDFNNDGLPDFALWQDPDFGPYGGSVYLYLGRKDGRYAASGTIVVSSATLFKPVPVDTGSARLLVCERRGGEAVPAGYSLDGFIVADLPRDELPATCMGANRAQNICREACADDDAPPPIERLDVERYRASGFQAWVSRESR